jgi:hypothetical protein
VLRRTAGGTERAGDRAEEAHGRDRAGDVKKVKAFMFGGDRASFEARTLFDTGQTRVVFPGGGRRSGS